MYRKTLLTSVAAAALFAFTVAYSAPASAGGDDTFKTGTKASLKLSGQVSRAVMMVDDGTNGQVFHVDNDNSSTRWRLVGSGKVTEKFSVGMRLEVQNESNPSNSVTMAGHESTTHSISERYADVTLTHKDFGKLYLGQGDPGSNGTAEISLSGVSIGSYVDAKVWGGGILFVNSVTNAQSGRSAGSGWDHHDGISRVDRIRYDTPKFAGFMGSVSHWQGDGWDITLRHAGKFGQFKTSAAIAYVDYDQVSPGGQVANATDDRVDGSFSILHDSGLNITVSAGVDDNKAAGRADDDHIYVQLGYIAKLTDYGTTRFGVSWGNANDVGANGDDYTVWSLAVVQNLKAIGADLFAAYRNHDLDAVAETDGLDDIDVFVFGTRVSF